MSKAGVVERGTRWPLAGREGELAAFGRVWRESRCRAVVVCGPAGVGKSRLAEECLSRTVCEGWKTGRATATAAAAAVPLGAIAHLIPDGVDLSDPVMGFSAVARVLAGPRRDRRWALLVDDLHLLDAASAVLLRQLLDAGTVRLIGTVRSGEPAGDAVAALTGGDAAHRIDLATFSEQQVDRVLRAALGAPVGRRTLHELSTASGGNVLYLRELVLGALQTGTLTCDGEIWELAEGALPATPKLTELIGARLAAAPPADRPVLELLALCEPLPLTDAQTLSSPEVLAGLEDTGLIRLVTDRRRTTLTLAHPLYGEILRASIPALRRRTLLLDQAERTQAHGARRRDDPLHIASWQLTATGTADPAQLVQAAALARHADDFEQVTTLLQALPADDRTYASCLLHGDALVQLGQQWQLADTLLAEAETRAPGEPERVTATLARTLNLWHTAPPIDEALRVNDTALGQVTSPAARHMLRVNEGALRAYSGQPARGLALLQELETDPRDAPDANIWTFAAVGKTGGLTFAGHTGEAIAWGKHAYAAHLQIQDQGAGHPPATQLDSLIIALADAGRLAPARETSERMFNEVVAVNAPVLWVWAAYVRGRVEWLAGDAAAARRWYAELLGQSRARHYPRLLVHACTGLAASAAVLGDLDAAETALAEMPTRPSTGFYAGEEDLGQAWLLAVRGHLGRARAVLTEAAARARATGYVTSEALLLTDVARLGGAKDVADRLAELTHTCDGTFATARARLAAALAADDPDLLQAAATELEAIGANLLAAEAAITAAAAWRRAGNTRRAAAATQQAQACAARCPGARTPLLATAETAHTLTRREREIALLAAAGTSSKDIAQALHLSVRTVDNHLQHAYAKLGVTTRRELADTLGTASTT